jgi:hypothetical protein
MTRGAHFILIMNLVASLLGVQSICTLYVLCGQVIENMLSMTTTCALKIIRTQESPPHTSKFICNPTTTR